MPTGLARQTAVIINAAISRELRDLARGQVLEVDCPLTLSATADLINKHETISIDYLVIFTLALMMAWDEEVSQYWNFLPGHNILTNIKYCLTFSVPREKLKKHKKKKTLRVSNLRFGEIQSQICFSLWIKFLKIVSKRYRRKQKARNWSWFWCIG